MSTAITEDPSFYKFNYGVMHIRVERLQKAEYYDHFSEMYQHRHHVR